MKRRLKYSAEIVWIQQLEQTGDYKERFRELVVRAGKEFNEGKLFED